MIISLRQLYGIGDTFKYHVDFGRKALASLLICGLMFCLLILLPHVGYADNADNVVFLHDGKESYPVSRYVGFIEDKTRQLSLKDIFSANLDSSFTYLHKDTINFGLTQSAYWTRLELENRHSTVSEWYLEAQYPLIDRIDAYLVYQQGRVESVSSGDTLPFAQRAIKHRHPMFKIILPKNEKVIVYLRAKSEGAVQFPLVLWSTHQLLAKDHEEQYVLGIYYGVLLAIFFYNLMLYFSIRDVNYLYYLIYIGGWIIMQMSINGLAFEYLWPASPRWANIVVPFSLGVLVFSISLFSSAFLQIKLHFPRVHWIFKAYLGLGIFIGLGAFLLPYALINKIAQVSALTESVIIFIIGSICLKKGVRQAKYFMLAWSFLLVGNVMYIMQNSGLIPTIFLTEYGLQIGSALEVLLLSFALAHRVRLLKEENERIEHEATVNLERRVQQRTVELDNALKNLSDANQKLQYMSRIDGLTGIKNRAYFNEKLDVEWRRVLRSENPTANSIGLLMIDIDYFKKINDTYGHLAGDICLKKVAEAISQVVRRASDDLFRYGGEEFVVMLPNTDINGVAHLGELIRKDIESLVVFVNDIKIPITISVGVACMSPAIDITVDVLLDRADKALYQAKNNGRNQVCVASTSYVSAQ